jgi:hypothetical protein
MAGHWALSKHPGVGAPRGYSHREAGSTAGALGTEKVPNGLATLATPDSDKCL